jgi:tetratricopeptide (TPR) repeat protein
MQQPSQVETLLVQAAQAQRDGRGPEALRLYRNVLALAPGNYLALANLGIAAIRDGDLVLGRALLEAALKVQPDSVETWMALGNAHARSRDFERAAAAFRSVVRLRPGLAAAHINLGNALRRTGHLPAALTALRRGLSIDDSLASGYLNLGLALEEAGDQVAALDAFAQALRREPGHAGARMALGNAFLRGGRVADALDCFEQVAREAPGFPGARHNRGVALQALGRDAEAVVEFRAASSEAPGDLEARNNLIVALIRSGETGDALQECAEYERLAPAHPRALAYRAAALLELGWRAEAATLLDFERLVIPCMIATPAGFGSVAAFNSQLAAQVTAHASLIYEPAGKSTHGGSQTGEFTDGAEGAAAALRAAIIDTVRTYMSHLRRALPAHPFVAALPSQWRLATWAVSLRSQGYQGPHFHPDGRISGVYYVAIPDTVARASDGAGALEFGRTQSRDAIGGDAQPLLHTLKPQEGMMVLFPSYFYHRTLPFVADQPRISVAFDILPPA